MAAPIAAHAPDLVLHGHAHAGAFEGRIGPVPVYNVAAHVIGQDFWVFDVAVQDAGGRAVPRSTAERELRVEVEEQA
jgi:hypothetical protein